MATAEGRARSLVPFPKTCETLGGVSRTTVYALVDANELTRVKIGRRSFITSDSLDEYMDRLRGEAM